jgi:hypothetical protein
MGTTMTSRTRLGTAALGLALALSGAGTAAAQTGPPTESLSRADLRGRALDVRVRCETDTTARLSSRFGKARQATIACRDGGGRAKLRLTAREAALAAGTTGVEVELALGTGEPKVLEFRRPSKRGAKRPLARSASGGYWDLAYASCAAMSGFRHLDIFTNGTVWGDRAAPAGYYWGYNPGSTIWISFGAQTFNPVTGAYGWSFAPWRPTIVGTRDSHNFNIPPNAWVKPVIEVYGGQWNWVRTVYASGFASRHANDWCYFQ